MSSVSIVWKGQCRDPQTRYRLLGHLHRLAARSDEFLRLEQPQAVQGANRVNTRDGRAPGARPNVETVDRDVSGAILVSSFIARDLETFTGAAREAGAAVVENPEEENAPFIALKNARLRGLDFKLFDPRGLYPDADRMSFVFLECPEYPFLDGRLAEVATREECGASGVATLRDTDLYLCAPSVRLCRYLEDWTDCLFSWIKFFLIDDFWWHRQEALQGFADYRDVFEALQAERGAEQAEEAAFDAVLATFGQHAEHWTGEVEGWATAEPG